MSLREKFEEFSKEEEINPRFIYNKVVQRAFYAGAEAHAQETGHSVTAFHEIQAEIDRFKGMK